MVKNKKPTLAEFGEWLEEFRVPKGGRFNMGQWECGTTRCAIGWGIHEGVLPGMELKETFFGLIPTYGDTSGLDSIADYFKIHRRAASRIFIRPRSKRGCLGALRRAVREQQP